jgi:hypothetical protein
LQKTITQTIAISYKERNRLILVNINNTKNDTDKY